MPQAGFAKTVLESMAEQVMVIDRGYEIVYANQALASVVGETPSDLVGRHCYEVTHDRAAPCVEGHGDCPYDVVFEEQRSVQAVHEHRGEGGETRYVKLTSSPVFDDDGEVVQLVEVMTDVTEERRLAADLELFSDLLDDANDEIYVIDPETGAFQMVNQTAGEELGYTTDDLLEMNICDVELEIESQADWRAHLESRPTQYTFEGRHRRRDGSIYPVEVTAATRTIGGQAHHIAIARDVTERHERERQLQVFGRVARHNFRNAITVIDGVAKDIEETVPEDLKPDATRIQQVAAELLSLAEKEYEISTFLSEPAETRVLNLSTVVTWETDVFAERYPTVDIRTEVPEDLSVKSVSALGRAVGELVENAIVHNDTENPQVEVRAVRTEECVVLTVSDTCAPIPTEEIAILTTADRERITDLQHGSGLGLWLVNWIVARSGGRIEVERTDSGNTVTLSLPPAEPDT